MQVTLKLYASLGAYLPAHAERNEAPVDVTDGASIKDLLDAYNVPREVLPSGVTQRRLPGAGCPFAGQAEAGRCGCRLAAGRRWVIW